MAPDELAELDRAHAGTMNELVKKVREYGAVHRASVL
jgi:hypothetical protein